MKTLPIMEVAVGCMARRRFRAYLKGVEQLGYDLDWDESRGWFESHFTIQAQPSILRVLTKIAHRGGAGQLVSLTQTTSETAD